MTSLYTHDTLICKMREMIFPIFDEATKPTAQHLLDMMLSVYALNGFQSVKYNYEHFINEISEYELNSCYYTLNESNLSLDDWMKHLMEVGLSLVSPTVNLPVIPAIDDTLIEKYGEMFENWGKLFDHAAHNGSNYLNGHCFVSLLLCVPVCDESGCRYVSFPVAYRMWTKEKTKLEMAAELVQPAMKTLGPQRQVVLCLDSWYPKGCVKNLIEEYPNLTMICNVRKDTAIYELPPEKTGKKGRPRVRGERLSLEDLSLKEIPENGLSVGFRPVKTMLFGRRTVYAMVSKSTEGDSYRLFIATNNPKELNIDLNFFDERSAAFAKTDADFAPLTFYSQRWGIETAYYEQKTFWALGDYRLRSQEGIERLVNLLTICYASAKLLPYLSEDFAHLKGLSAQQIRFVLGRHIRQEVFFAHFVDRLENAKISPDILNTLKSLMFFGHLAA